MAVSGLLTILNTDKTILILDTVNFWTILTVNKVRLHHFRDEWVQFVIHSDRTLFVQTVVDQICVFGNFLAFDHIQQIALLQLADFRGHLMAVLDAQSRMCHCGSAMSFNGTVDI